MEFKTEFMLVEKNFHDHPHIARVQLNRPKVLNALSTAVMNDLVDNLMQLDDDQDVRVIVLTGNEKAFAAGADISEMKEASPAEKIGEKRFRAWKMLSLIEKPLIAAVNGFALGGGCELAMSCDLILAGDSAKFGQPEINIGTTPGAGGTQRLTRALGKAKSMYYCLSGEMIEASEAYKLGLVAKVFPAETLQDEAFEFCKKIASKAPFAARLVKESVNKAFETTLQEGLEYERRNFFLTFSTEDQKEGMKAFLEKRKPKYMGK